MRYIGNKTKHLKFIDDVIKDIESKKKTYYPKSDKYYIISFGYEDFYETYEVTQFVLKSNDKK